MVRLEDFRCHTKHIGLGMPLECLPATKLANKSNKQNNNDFSDNTSCFCVFLFFRFRASIVALWDTLQRQITLVKITFFKRLEKSHLGCALAA